VFLTLMVVGLVGLVMMAVPALFGAGHGTDHGAGHAGHLPPVDPGHAGHVHVGHIHAGHAHAHGPSGADKLIAATAVRTGRSFIPSPRAVFSLCALYGACGNALVHAGHLSVTAAALIAIVPALAVERFLIRPVWNLMFRFQAPPSSPLEELILGEAQAVVPFRNGRGLVSIVRDGRRVQLHARLREQDAALPVNFGQRLRIEDVDARQERVTVSLIANGQTDDVDKRRE
jgi:hypothetical protein